MTELLKQETLRMHSNDLLCSVVENVQRSSRCRFGQTRAPKRCIIDYKRGSQRQRHHPKSENNKQSIRATATSRSSHLNPTPNSVAVPVLRPPSQLRLDSPPSSPDSDALSPEGQSPVLADNKRLRAELGSSEPMPDLSSSAPASCMRTTHPPVLLIDQGSPTAAVRERSPQFACQASMINTDLLGFLLTKEPHYHPNNAFLYYVNPEVDDKVDATLRNEAVHNLRFMHGTFFSLSTETFCKAVNLIDRFIVKVKVKPKYMACVATASYCAASKLCDSNKKGVELPAPETLVHITRCGGNAADLLRMEEILDSKLSHDLDGVNAYDFMRVFIDCLTVTASTASPDTKCGTEPEAAASVVSGAATTDAHHHHQHLVRSDAASPTSKSAGAAKFTLADSLRVQRKQLIRRLMTRLEISLCSLEVYRFRPACLALAILAQAGVKELTGLADLCEVDWTDVVHCASLVASLYDLSPTTRRSTNGHLSRRTLFRIGYSKQTPLDTITEDCEPPEEDEWLLSLLFEP